MTEKLKQTRRAVAERAGIGERTLRRWLEEGKVQPDARGRIRPADLARLKREEPEPDVALADQRSIREDFDERHRALVERYVSDAVWIPRWRAFNSAVQARVAKWPAQAAGVLGPMTLHEALYVDTASREEAPRVIARLSSAEILALLARPPASWPLPIGGDDQEATADSLRAVAKDGDGIVVIPGGWVRTSEWDQAQRFVPVRPPAVDLLMTMLTDLADWSESSPLLSAVRETLVAPAAPEPVPEATDVADAKMRTRVARSAYRAARVACRRGHFIRVDLAELIQVELDAFRSAVWTWRDEMPELAGNPEAVRVSFAAALASALKRFRSLGGVIKEEMR